MQDMPPEHSFVPLDALESRQRTQRYNQRRENVVNLGIHELNERDGRIDPLLWEGLPVPPRQWVVEGLIPRGEVTMLTGNGGEGKSLITMQLLVATAIRSRWIGRGVPHIKSLGIYCEDDKEELQRRSNSILRHHGRSFADLDGLMLVSRKGMDSVMYDAQFNDMVGHPTAFYERVRKTAMGWGAELIVLDSLYNFFGGNENARPQANQFINMLASIAQEIHGAVVIVAHPSRAGMSTGTGDAGSTAWHNAVRSRLYLHREKPAAWELEKDPHKKGDLILQPMKANYAAPEDAIKLVWERGCFVPVVSHAGPMPDYFGERRDD
jgi:RecA-family ATPase